MITAKELQNYLEQCPENAEVKIGIGKYESSLVEILLSPISDDKIILADKTYMKDLKEL